MSDREEQLKEALSDLTNALQTSEPSHSSASRHWRFGAGRDDDRRLVVFPRHVDVE
jgi:hypothetical protein